MAITNAQQARQLYQFGGGADMGKERGTETGREPGPVGGGQGVRGDTPRGDGPATGAPSQGLIGEIRRQQLEKAPDIVERQKFNVLDFIPGVGLIRRLSDILPPGGKPFDAQGFGSGQGGGPQAMVDIPTWMRLGFSSEAEYLASLEDEENKEAEEGLRLAFRADGGRIGLQEGGGIEQRLEQLGGDVTSAEQMLQGINQRLKTAESSLGSGGGGLGTLAPGVPTGLNRVPEVGPSIANITVPPPPPGVTPTPLPSDKNFFIGNAGDMDSLKAAYANAQKQAQ
jgi:hypothetical protein